ncbi:MAG: hypothetical protein LQ352_000460 [Teloschistes flavicans]|nr:MAG: hypothetical protein LQ352_000460 [Teloschistes flavicans]
MGESGEQGSWNLQLPLSPLMDPERQSARNRYKMRKPEPSSELSEFQKKLQKSPYAKALATPVRSCALTGARLPSYFLLDFGLAPHPRTGKPWQMPKLAIDCHTASLHETSRLDANPEQQESASSGTDTDGGAASHSRKPARTVAGSHIISQRSSLKLMSSLKYRTVSQSMPLRWKQDGRFKAQEIVWREDMDTFVLDLMRRKTIKLLKYLSAQPAAYVVACEGFQDIENKHQPGAVVWLGEPRSYSNPTTEAEDPPPYAMVEYRSSGHMPIYNLPALLGPNYLILLRNAGKPFDKTLAVIKKKRNTTEVQLHLWKLMGYFASDCEVI